MTRLSELRSTLLSHSLFAPTTLAKAVKQLGFVQADPIRSPARSQDLILRHRVKNYKAGDLEKRYPKLELEEDFTFAYGFLPKRNRDLLYPREAYPLSSYERKVIETVKRLAPAHPSAISEACGDESVKNAWGGQSKRAKRALENGHLYGHLRVTHRENGIRLYGPTDSFTQRLSPAVRFRELILMTATLFGPTSERFLLKELTQYRYLAPKPTDRRSHLNQLVEEGQLRRERVESIDYIIPETRHSRGSQNETVRFLAPFDPIVRDRDRFEQLWSWTYRFEAYTPAAKRIRGYYALPLLWREAIIGWVNAKVIDQALQLEVGYVTKPRQTAAYQQALEAEAASFARFLHLPSDAWRLRYI